MREKVPVIVGGTSFYFKSLLYENFIPAVKQNTELREELADKDAEELMEMLESLDTQRAKNIDTKNKPRIIRSIEIATELGSVPMVEDKIKENLDIEFIWVHKVREEQRERIANNFRTRMENRFLDEAERLRSILLEHYNNDEEMVKKRFFEIGLGYKHIFKL